MFQVSWLKRVGEEKEPHLLTFGRQTYSSDARFQIIYEKPNNWKLQIQFTKKSDVGLYECMVSIFMKKQYSYLLPEFQTIRMHISAKYTRI